MNKTLTGYCDPLSASPGETVHFKVSCESTEDYEVEIVRVICGDDSVDAAGLIEHVVPSEAEGRYPGRRQQIRTGSFGLVEAAECLSGIGDFSVEVFVYPTAPGRGRQTILSLCQPEQGRGFALGIGADGDLELWLDGARFASGVALQVSRWHAVAARYQASDASVSLEQRPLPESPGNDLEARDDSVRFAGASGSFETPAGAPLVIGARASVFEGAIVATTEHFNGKIEAPRIHAGNELVARWDFSLEMPSQRIVDQGPHGLDGHLYQSPTRAVTGHNWDGSVHAWTQAPDQYAAIHFHDDDIVDAGWSTDFSLVIPQGLASGIYAARLRQGASEDRITFFVRARPGRATSKLALLVPTASYLAYANYRLRLVPNPIFGDGGPKGSNDEFLLAHPELGSSLYDRHSDYSGVHFSSRLRPIQNLKSGGNRAWQFPADTNLVAWLHQLDQPYDVVTDEDLHREGEALLAPYRCVMTGTHPEYTSSAMLDAVEGYLHGGGRLMYMGGNGFYWRIAWSDDLAGVIEVRRAEDGTRAWIAQPGEYYHAFNGEYGGLWRRIGRSPNRLVGVGFAAQGFDHSGYYRRTPGADDPRAAFIFRGVDEEIIGDFGSIGGGAAGEEIDRYDARLGSPRHALVVATSEGHGEDMLRTKEEYLSTVPYFEDPKVRADLVFFECPNGGAVFSTGSIAWCGSLGHNNGDNNVARITSNVLHRFLDASPFDPAE
ncbi:MAG: N,N-dimethylformamidase beta subunit family domain-containing protein [Acidobacteriota bacterium]|nr:N,N-dimethylformamidase beta subunit family domain-containing protein [Acidobacteriota bacterium]